MNTHADKTQENKSQSIANKVSQKQGGGDSTFQFVDNRHEAVAQRKLQEMANNSPQAKRAAQLQAMADNYSAQQYQLIQKKEKKTGLPDKLKTGIENLSGYSMDDVKVHRNSDQPAQLNAHAFAQGTDIHLAAGQEKHLPHEAWHVVQQAQGRVKPTMQMKDGVPVNDDAGLEREADVMGEKAAFAVNMSDPLGIFQRRAESAEAHPQLEPTGGQDEKGPLNFLSSIKALSQPTPNPNVVQRKIVGGMELEEIVGNLGNDYKDLLKMMNESNIYMWEITNNMCKKNKGHITGNLSKMKEWPFKDAIEDWARLKELSFKPQFTPQQELETDFVVDRNKDKLMLELAVRAADFLLDKGRVKQALLGLEGELKKRLGDSSGGEKNKEVAGAESAGKMDQPDKLAAANKYLVELKKHNTKKGKNYGNKSEPPIRTKEASETMGFLDYFLTEFEAKAGFPAMEEIYKRQGSARVISEFLVSSEFEKMINEGTHWMDVGAGGGHGIFTHRLQWHLLVFSDTIPIGQAFALYKFVGTTHPVIDEGVPKKFGEKVDEKNEEDPRNRRMWDAVVDRTSANKKDADFVPWKSLKDTFDGRAPVELRNYVLAEKESFPTLCALDDLEENKKKASAF